MPFTVPAVSVPENWIRMFLLVYAAVLVLRSCTPSSLVELKTPRLRSGVAVLTPIRPLASMKSLPTEEVEMATLFAEGRYTPFVGTLLPLGISAAAVAVPVVIVG